MLKQTRTYVDFDGNKRTEDFWFHLTKAEITELQLSVDGGLQEMIRRMVAAQDAPQIIKLMKEFVQLSYGVKSADGKRFEKSPELTAAFTQTQAYSDIFMELAFDDEAAAKFIQGVVPADMAEAVASAQLEVSNA